MKTTSAALLCAAALAAACGKAEIAKAPEEIRTVRVHQVAERATSRQYSYAGEVRARHETRLAFRVGGKMIERSVQVGSRVKAGEAIARIDPADLALAADNARALVAGIEAERSLANSELTRYRDLREKNFISQAEYDRRAQTLASAQARLDSARSQQGQSLNQAAYGTLRADSAGVITAVEAEAGQVVSTGQTVARLARLGEIEIAFAVPESQRHAIQHARDFKISAGALPGRSWKGRLRELSPAADPVTRTYAARVSILAADRLELGMSARVEASSAERAAAVELPLAALYSRGATPQVFVLQGDIVKLQPVTLGAIGTDTVVVDSGLSAGERVVTAGAQLLRPGQRVRPLAEKVAGDAKMAADGTPGPASAAR